MTLQVSGLSSDIARLQAQLEQTEREKAKLEERNERAESDRSELTLLLRSMDEERRCLESKLKAAEEIGKKSQPQPSHSTHLRDQRVIAADDGGEAEAQRRAVMAEEKLVEANERGKMAEEKMREADDKAREAEKGLREAEDKAMETEKKLKDTLDEVQKAREAQKEAEEKCIVLEEHLRLAKDDLRRALADKAKGVQIRGEIERRQMEAEILVREVSQKLEVETERCSALEEQLVDAEKKRDNLAEKNAALIARLASAEKKATLLEKSLQKQLVDSEGRKVLALSEIEGLRKSAKEAAETVLSANESAEPSEVLGTSLQMEIEGLGNILSEVERFLCEALRSVPHASIEITRGPRSRTGWQADIRQNLQRGISVLADIGDKSGAAASSKRVFVTESGAASKSVESLGPHDVVTSPSERAPSIFAASRAASYETSRESMGDIHRSEESLALNRAVNVAIPSIMPTLRPGANGSLDEEEEEVSSFPFMKPLSVLQQMHGKTLQSHAQPAPL